MNIRDFVEILGAEFYTGVPDSLLQPLNNYLMQTYGISAEHHIIGANEGNCVGLAAGYYLASKKPGVVYLQNSGIGNIINPIASLLNERIYGIPCIFVIGWRGEPGVPDEPQHAFQGLVTLKLMEDMDVATYVITKETSIDELKAQMVRFRDLLCRGKQVAFIVKKGALQYENKVDYKNPYSLVREKVIAEILQKAGDSLIVSTTGKISREVFEQRELHQQSHDSDFLTVGSMGHSSSIALELALKAKDQRVICIDGDGAVLMHMGALATVGSMCPDNFVHIVLNNGAHESVGGLPTTASTLNLAKIAEACGYCYTKTVATQEALDAALSDVMSRKQCCFLEVKTSLFSRSDLGRPTVSAAESCKRFVRKLHS